MKNNFKIGNITCKKINTKSEITYPIIIIGLFLQILFFTFDNAFIKLVGVLILVIASIIFKPNSAYILFLFLLPNQRLIEFPYIGNSALILVLIVVLMKLLIYYKINYQKIIISFLYILLLYFATTSVFFKSFINVSLLIKILIYLFVPLFLIIYNKANYIWFESTVKVFILGVLAAALLSLFFGEYSEIMSGSRLSAGEFNNANIFSSMVSFTISVTVFQFFLNPEKRFSYSIFILMLGIIGISTQSRSFLLAMVFVIMVFVLKGLFDKRMFKHTLLIILFFLFFIFALVEIIGVTFISDVFYSAIDRVINPRRGDITGSRFDIWSHYYDVLINDYKILFFGIGGADYKTIFNINSVPHNSILGVIVSVGLIGLILYISLFYIVWKMLSLKFIYKDRNYRKYNLYSLLPLFIIILTSMTGHSFLNMAFISQMLISFHALLFAGTSKYQ